MSDLPRSVAQNTITVLGVELTVHVLDSGQRIIEAEGMEALFEAMASDVPMTDEDAAELALSLRGSI